MADKFQWGPVNPHPLSQMRTELVWEGKYDEYGRRREVDIAGHAMPLQKIETVDEPRSQAFASGNLELFERKRKKADDFRNLLIWGDNKVVMASLLRDFKGKIDLIYIDPPFDVGADFTMNLPIGTEEEVIEKDQSTLEMVAYRDMWGKGTDSYLHMMQERLNLMKELLSEKGSIYVHCDYRVSAFLRLIIDDVFRDHFQNEIVWHYRRWTAGSRKFQNMHDTILFATKSSSYAFNPVSVEPTESQRAVIEKGYNVNVVKAKGSGKVRQLLVYDRDKVKYLIEQGTIDPGNYGRVVYIDAKETVAPDVWVDIQFIHSQADERTDFPTQKPEALLERIISVSTEPGALVADFFCGSGTTGAVAERLGHRWIMTDLGRFAIHTSRKRLIELQRNLHTQDKPYRAFDVYNLGRYERQWWQKDRLQGAEEEHRRVVLDFFRAEILTNAASPLLHGRKAGAYCYVEPIDSIFTRDEAGQVAKAVAQAGGKEVYCLAWEFEMDLRLHTAALEQELGIKMKLIPIPREIMEKNRKSPPPFLEMAVLEAESVRRKQGGKSLVDVKLTKFLPSLAEVPTKELEVLKERAVKSGFDFIDFWAVDFDWAPGKPFNHHWQDYRTRKDRSLKTVSDAGYEYAKPGKHTICVKIVDVFGCDTSITLEVEV